MLENKSKRSIIHQILTRHNYDSIDDFGNRVNEFRLRMYDSDQDKARLSKLPEYGLSSLDFENLPEAIDMLIGKDKITIK